MANRFKSTFSIYLMSKKCEKYLVKAVKKAGAELFFSTPALTKKLFLTPFSQGGISTLIAVIQNCPVP